MAMTIGQLNALEHDLYIARSGVVYAWRALFRSPRQAINHLRASGAAIDRALSSVARLKRDWYELD